MLHFLHLFLVSLNGIAFFVSIILSLGRIKNDISNDKYNDIKLKNSENEKEKLRNFKASSLSVVVLIISVLIFIFVLRGFILDSLKSYELFTYICTLAILINCCLIQIHRKEVLN